MLPSLFSAQTSHFTLNKLAWRNLWRHRRRTLLLVVVVAYATIVTLFFWGMTDGFGESIMSNYSRYLAAPITVTSTTYHTDPDPQNALPELNVQQLDQAAPRIEFAPLLRSPYRTQAADGRGILPAKEAKFGDFQQKISSGRMFENANEIVLGADLAKQLNVRLGERIVLDSSSPEGPQTAGLTVTGFLRTGLAMIDERTALMHLDTARKLTGVTTATSLNIFAERGQEVKKAKELQAFLPAGVTAYPISEKLGPMGREIQNGRAQMVPIGVLLSIFAALAVASTVLVSVLERTREFGVMMSLGLSQNQLVWLIMAEAFLATLLGWLIGLVLGFALTISFAHWNILGPLFAMGDAFKGLGIGDEIYTASHWIYAVYAAATLLLSVIFTALVPARRIHQLSPAEAMRAH